MKVVIDTNILVSGLYFKGAPFKILQAWLDHSFTVYATPKIIQEYIRAIDYLAYKRKPNLFHNWDVKLPEICDILPDEEEPVKICRDKDDDKFLYCCLRSKASYLITGDNDLKVLKDLFKFQIVSPAQFVFLMNKL